MGLKEDIALRALSDMSAEERHNLMVRVVDQMLAGMSSEDRRGLMDHVVDHFLDTLPNEERVEVVRRLVPSLMAQLMKSGNMSVDDLLWTAMGSLGALDKPPDEQEQGRDQSGGPAQDQARAGGQA